jgi:glycosyltransferase involved in cell wall biosynthesis
MKTVLFFGIHDPNYSRTRVLTKGFIENGWKVEECRVDPKKYSGISKYLELWKLGREKRKNKYDLVIVSYPGQTVTWLGYLIFGKNIIFDAFLSFYDSNVFDRKIYGKYSPRAFKDFFFDWISAMLARYTLLDTFEHIDYYSRTFRIPKKKFKRVLVGTDGEIFLPGQKQNGGSDFIVEFHGMFIPLQGVDRILEAAEELKLDKEIKFKIIGDGQTYVACREKADALQLKNVEFLPRMLLAAVAQEVQKADICLGIFGNTEKTQRVIPNKVYECVAAGKPVITIDSPAVKEVFTHKKDIILSSTTEGRKIAENILLLKNNKDLREGIGRKAYETYKEKCAPNIIVKTLLSDLNM